MAERMVKEVGPGSFCSFIKSDFFFFPALEPTVFLSSTNQTANVCSKHHYPTGESQVVPPPAKRYSIISPYVSQLCAPNGHARPGDAQTVSAGSLEESRLDSDLLSDG